MPIPKLLKPISDSAGRVLTKIGLFLLILLSAYLLNLAVSWAGGHQLLPPLMINTLKVVAYIIFFLDVLNFLVFIVQEVLRGFGVLPPP